LGESLTKLGKIIGNLNNFWGKSLMKLGEFTINLAKIRNKLGESSEPWIGVIWVWFFGVVSGVNFLSNYRCLK
jgi:hypothetical protein